MIPYHSTHKQYGTFRRWWRCALSACSCYKYYHFPVRINSNRSLTPWSDLVSNDKRRFELLLIFDILIKDPRDWQKKGGRLRCLVKQHAWVTFCLLHKRVTPLFWFCCVVFNSTQRHKKGVSLRQFTSAWKLSIYSHLLQPTLIEVRDINWGYKIQRPSSGGGSVGLHHLLIIAKNRFCYLEVWCDTRLWLPPNFDWGGQYLAMWYYWSRTPQSSCQILTPFANCSRVIFAGVNKGCLSYLEVVLNEIIDWNR